MLLWLILTLLGSASTPVVRAAPQGNVYVVTRIDDPAGSGSIGNLSLRQAVMYANADPGSTIQLTHGATYNLTIPSSGNDDATTGDLNITADTTIEVVNGICNPIFNNCRATIQGGAGWSDRLIYVANARVTASSLNLRNGHPVGSIGGGAIFVNSTGVLTLTYSTVSENSAVSGGGLSVYLGEATLNNVQVISNTATGTVAAGAGIWNDGGLLSITAGLIDSNQGDAQGGGIETDLGGIVTLSNTIVSQNHTTQDGGGLYIASGWLTLINSQVISNTANGNPHRGGGIMVHTGGDIAVVTLTNTNVTTNTAAYQGGGIAVWPDYNTGGSSYLTIAGGSLSANTAQQAGGGLEYNPTFCGVPCSNQLTMTGTQIMNNAANSSGGAGLDLSTGLYTATIANSVIANNQTPGSGGGLYSNGRLVIDNTYIQSNIAGQAGGGYYNSGGIVAIRDTTITNNIVGGTNNNLSTGGGGMYNYGTLTLDNVNIVGNVAFYGGAGGLINRSFATINNSTIAGNAVITLTGGLINTGIMALHQTTISGNTATYDAGVRNLGSLTINGGAIRDNHATGFTAGLDNIGTLSAIGLSINNNLDDTGYSSGLYNGGTAWLTDTQIISNATPLGWGAGLFNDGFPANLTLWHVSILSNTAQAASGIYNNEGTITMTASTIAHNVATAGAGGGILNATFPSIPGHLYGSLQMDSSTLFDNRSSDNGGGIYNSHIISITNSTISGNRAANDGGGLYSDAGYDPTPMAYLDNVTIANNLADSDNSGVGKGGGVAIVSGTVSVRNTLIGTNTDLSGQAPDCSGVLTSDRYNLVQNIAGCTITGNLIGNITGQDPKLGPLQNNGGATWTQALLSGSPAINAGNPTTPGSGLAACLSADQRGLPRPLGGRCDIGAVEMGALAFLPVLER